jgi:hypothetical protein
VLLFVVVGMYMPLKLLPVCVPALAKVMELRSPYRLTLLPVEVILPDMSTPVEDAENEPPTEYTPFPVTVCVVPSHV